MPSHKEEAIYGKMRRNVSRTVSLKFKHYELRTKALIETSKEQFEVILPSIKLKSLKRWFIREELIFEVKKIKNAVNADLQVEVFSVYGTETYIGEYSRYLGELEIFVAGIDKYEQTSYRFKKALTYFQQPEKSDFIPERL